MLGTEMTDTPTLNLVFGIASSQPKLTLEDHEALLESGTPNTFWPIALPYAQEAAPITNVSISVILAQWAIETAYGGYDWTTEHNPGNVGSFDGQPLNNMPNLADGVQAYEQCMLQAYYNAVREGPNNWYNESLALGQSPWASAHYALPGSYPGSALIWVINNYNLTQYDVGGPTPAPSPAPAPVSAFRKPLSGVFGKLNDPAIAVCPDVAGDGYTIVAADGGTFDYGTAHIGSIANIKLTAPIVDAKRTPDNAGLTLVATDGGVFNLGTSRFYGSMGGKALNAPVVGVAVTPSGNGYWLVGTDGGIFAYGDAQFFGSTGAMKLSQPVVGIAATQSGNGYWLFAADGGVFAYGDAQFYGSMGGKPINKPVVAGARSAAAGYWEVGTDGGIFAFNAPFEGSAGSLALAAQVVNFAGSPSGNGYWLVAADGGIFNYGDAGFHGSPG